MYGRTIWHFNEKDEKKALREVFKMNTCCFEQIEEAPYKKAVVQAVISISQVKHSGHCWKSNDGS